MEGDRGRDVVDTELPKALVESILCLTTPIDACRMACISSTFRSAADSDTVWRLFLPSDYKSLVDMAADSSPISHSSLKELYFLLCDGNFLTDDRSPCFWLDRRSGKKCFMIWANCLFYSVDAIRKSWISLPESRSPFLAELDDVTSLELSAVLHLQRLFPETRYGIYLVFKSEVASNGIEGNEAGAEDGVANREYYKSSIYLFTGMAWTEQKNWISGRRRHSVMLTPAEKVVEAKEVREDGWAEMELGEVFSGHDDDDSKGSGEEMLSISIRDVRPRSRIIIQGMEFRPKPDVKVG